MLVYLHYIADSDDYYQICGVYMGDNERPRLQCLFGQSRQDQEGQMGKNIDCIVLHCFLLLLIIVLFVLCPTITRFGAINEIRLTLI